MASKCKLATNGPQWYNMSCYCEVCPFMATFVAAELIVVNFEELIRNWLRKSFDDRDIRTFHNSASNSPVCHPLVNDDLVCSRVWSMNALVHIGPEEWNLGLVYQVMACTVFWDKIGQIWFKGVYNGPIFVMASKDDRLGLYLSLYYLLWAILALTVRFGRIAIKVPGKDHSGQKWSIIMQYFLL